MTVDEAVQFYEEDRASRMVLEAAWAYQVFVKVAAERLNLGLVAKQAFLHHPNHEVVRAVITELVANGWSGEGPAPTE